MKNNSTGPPDTTHSQDNKNDSDSARFITPPNLLKQKVGSGGFDPAAVQRVKHLMNNNPQPYEEYLKDCLDDLSASINLIESEDYSQRDKIAMMTQATMQLKSHGATFGYPLITETAEILLHFLESTDKMNVETKMIIQAHANTLRIILNNKLQGHGGEHGNALLEELYNACNRYFEKHGISAARRTTERKKPQSRGKEADA